MECTWSVCRCACESFLHQLDREICCSKNFTWQRSSILREDDVYQFAAFFHLVLSYRRRNSKIDVNGRREDWEGVVCIYSSAQWVIHV